MQYLGGKFRTRKAIAEVLRSLRNGRAYFEPFCGACWVLQEMDGERMASDGNEALITMYQALRAGWIPPSSVSEQEYVDIKVRKDASDPLTAFVGFGCSFGGKWFAGYARNKRGENYAQQARTSLLAQLPLIRDVRFIYGDYREFSPVRCLVYCDPPYEGMTAYGAFKGFDHAVFWETMRAWSRFNVVVVSEYQAPPDFKCIAEIPTHTALREGGKVSPRIERLFTI